MESRQDIRIIQLKETDSTNRWLRDYEGEEGKVLTVVVAESQTCGRGQGGNRWESEPGRNLTFSMRCRPRALGAARQFVLLEAGAVAVSHVLKERMGEGITVKWPNDVYWHDRKISGTLSECTVSGGYVGQCILGIGINVNQLRFLSDAPNPVSMAQICGRETALMPLLHEVTVAFSRLLGCIDRGCYSVVDDAYRERLFRQGVWADYEDRDGRFRAVLRSVAADGRLCLEREDGSLSGYAFKEVRFLV